MFVREMDARVLGMAQAPGEEAGHPEMDRRWRRK